MPKTPSQRRRYERMLSEASALLSAGGVDNLQMKDMPQRAGVSLATLYRYFPTKNHLMFAVSCRRYEDALEKISSEPPRGSSVRERVTNHLLREFNAGQRDPKLTAALTYVNAETSRTFGHTLEQISDLHRRIIRRVAGSGGPVSPQQQRLVPIVIDGYAGALRGWVAGVSSAADARFQIRMACRILDLPQELIDEDLASAASPERHLYSIQH
jgi:TetR/AcrR family transcriptional regulator, cholesterol catabolism regulator